MFYDSIDAVRPGIATEHLVDLIQGSMVRGAPVLRIKVNARNGRRTELSGSHGVRVTN